jgi:SAM-dependent methyltransferase
MDGSVVQFYDELAANYHLLFADWKRSIEHQGEVLDGLLRASLGDGPQRVLDCCCGIGTQAIGLALRGHRVRGTDLSPHAIERARYEAARFGVAIPFAVADVRALGNHVTDVFDVVLACDNALPHLTQDEELHQAVGQMAGRLRPGGLFLASTRDYDALVQERAAATPVKVLEEPVGRMTFQVWDWASDSKTYRVHQFIVQKRGEGWHTDHYATLYRALRREEFNAILRDAGLADIRWHWAEQTRYHQPIVTAVKQG